MDPEAKFTAVQLAEADDGSRATFVIHSVDGKSKWMAFATMVREQLDQPSPYRFDRFSERARRIMQLANGEAQLFNHEYIGTEHILLGLLRHGAGEAIRILVDLKVDLDEVRDAVKSLMLPGPEMIAMGKLPLTPRAKSAIERAIVAARDLKQNKVGTEHLLLGLAQELEGVAGRVLATLRPDVAQAVAKAVAEMSGQAVSAPPAPAPQSWRDLPPLL